MRLRPWLVHGFDGASRSKALSSQGPGAFFFSERLAGNEILLARARQTAFQIPLTCPIREVQRIRPVKCTEIVFVTSATTTSFSQILLNQ